MKNFAFILCIVSFILCGVFLNDADADQLDLSWQQFYSSELGMDLGREVGIDDQGFVYVAGHSGEREEQTITVVKYHPDGQEQWVQRFDEWDQRNVFLRDMVVTAGGDVYLTGGIHDVVTGADILAIHYDSQGDLQWYSTYDGADEIGEYCYDETVSIDVDSSGNAYIAGSLVGESQPYKFAVVKYDSIGDLCWVYSHEARYFLPDPHDEGMVGLDLLIDDSDNIYTTCAIYNESSAYVHSIFEKLDTDGNVVWDYEYRPYPLSKGNNFQTLEIDADGNLFAYGTSVGVPVGEELITRNQVVKLNPAGDLLWEAHCPNGGDGDSYRDMALDHEGSAIVIGHNLILDNESDIFAYKFDVDGDNVWSAVFDVEERRSSGERATGGVAVNASGDILIAGMLDWWDYWGDKLLLYYDRAGVLEDVVLEASSLYEVKIMDVAASGSSFFIVGSGEFDEPLGVQMLIARYDVYNPDNVIDDDDDVEDDDTGDDDVIDDDDEDNALEDDDGEGSGCGC